MEPTSPEAQAELARRHKAAATTVLGLIVATVLLSVLAFLAKPYLNENPNLVIDMAVRIVILILGLGSVVWRRTKFQPMRLQDIYGLGGVTGLLKTLEKTTIQLAVLGAAIASIGFIATLMTGNERYTFWAGAIAIIVFVYCYPTKSSWLPHPLPVRLSAKSKRNPVHFYTGFSGITKLLIHICLVGTLRVVVSPYVSFNPPRSTDSGYVLPVCFRSGSQIPTCRTTNHVNHAGY